VETLSNISVQNIARSFMAGPKGEVRVG